MRHCPRIANHCSRLHISILKHGRVLPGRMPEGLCITRLRVAICRSLAGRYINI
jgi:hypothetical protein